MYWSQQKESGKVSTSVTRKPLSDCVDSAEFRPQSTAVPGDSYVLPHFGSLTPYHETLAPSEYRLVSLSEHNEALTRLKLKRKKREIARVSAGKAAYSRYRSSPPLDCTTTKYDRKTNKYVTITKPSKFVEPTLNLFIGKGVAMYNIARVPKSRPKRKKEVSTYVPKREDPFIMVTPIELPKSKVLSIAEEFPDVPFVVKVRPAMLPPVAVDAPVPPPSLPLVPNSQTVLKNSVTHMVFSMIAAPFRFTYNCLKQFVAPLINATVQSYATSRQKTIEAGSNMLQDMFGQAITKWKKQFFADIQPIFVEKMLSFISFLYLLNGSTSVVQSLATMHLYLATIDAAIVQKIYKPLVEVIIPAVFSFKERCINFVQASASNPPPPAPVVPDVPIHPLPVSPPVSQVLSQLQRLEDQFNSDELPFESDVSEAGIDDNLMSEFANSFKNILSDLLGLGVGKVSALDATVLKKFSLVFSSVKKLKDLFAGILDLFVAIVEHVHHFLTGEPLRTEEVKDLVADVSNWLAQAQAYNRSDTMEDLKSGKIKPDELVRFADRGTELIQNCILKKVPILHINTFNAQLAILESTIQVATSLLKAPVGKYPPTMVLFIGERSQGKSVLTNLISKDLNAILQLGQFSPQRICSYKTEQEFHDSYARQDFVIMDDVWLPTDPKLNVTQTLELHYCASIAEHQPNMAHLQSKGRVPFDSPFVWVTSNVTSFANTGFKDNTALASRFAKIIKVRLNSAGLEMQDGSRPLTQKIDASRWSFEVMKPDLDYVEKDPVRGNIYDVDGKHLKASHRDDQGRIWFFTKDGKVKTCYDPEEIELVRKAPIRAKGVRSDGSVVPIVSTGVTMNYQQLLRSIVDNHRRMRADGGTVMSQLLTEPDEDVQARVGNLFAAYEPFPELAQVQEAGIFKTLPDWKAMLERNIHLPPPESEMIAYCSQLFSRHTSSTFHKSNGYRDIVAAMLKAYYPRIWYIERRSSVMGSISQIVYDLAVRNGYLPSNDKALIHIQREVVRQANMIPHVSWTEFQLILIEADRIHHPFFVKFQEWAADNPVYAYGISTAIAAVGSFAVVMSTRAAVKFLFNYLYPVTPAQPAGSIHQDEERILKRPAPTHLPKYNPQVRQAGLESKAIEDFVERKLKPNWVRISYGTWWMDVLFIKDNYFMSTCHQLDYFHRLVGENEFNLGDVICHLSDLRSIRYDYGGPDEVDLAFTKVTHSGFPFKKNILSWFTEDDEFPAVVPPESFVMFKSSPNTLLAASATGNVVSPFRYQGSTTIRWLSKAYAVSNSVHALVAGDCSATLYLKKGATHKIAGFAVANCPSYGYFQQINKQFVRRALSTLDELTMVREAGVGQYKFGMDFLRDKMVPANDDPPEFFVRNWEYVGKLQPQYYDQLSSKPCFKQSMIFDEMQQFGPSPKAPTRLRPFISDDGQLISPMQIALNKFDVPKNVVHELELYKTYMNLQFRCYLKSNVKWRPLTVVEAINDIHTEWGDLPHLNMKKSASWKLGVEKLPVYPGTSGKRQYIQFDDISQTYIPSPTLVNYMHDYLDQSSEFIPGISTAKLKPDEKRPLLNREEAAKIWKTSPDTHNLPLVKRPRVIQPCSLEQTIAIRMKLSQAIAAIANGRFSAMGLSAHDLDWDRLAREMHIDDPDYIKIDTDVQDNDIKQPAEFQAIFRDELVEFCRLIGAPSDQCILIANLLKSLHFRFVIIKGCVYWVQFSLGSGDPLTTPTNICILSTADLVVTHLAFNQLAVNTHEFKCKYTGLIIQPCAYPEHVPTQPHIIVDQANFRHFGDDHLMALWRGFGITTKWWVALYFYHTGYTLVPSTKVLDAEFTDKLSSEKIQFLGRGFKKIHGYYASPLNKESIRSMLYHVSINVPTDSGTRDNIQLVLIESFAHGEEFFNEISNQIITALQPHSSYPFRFSFVYQDYVDAWLKFDGSLFGLLPNTAPIRTVEHSPPTFRHCVEEAGNPDINYDPSLEDAETQQYHACVTLAFNILKVMDDYGHFTLAQYPECKYHAGSCNSLAETIMYGGTLPPKWRLRSGNASEFFHIVANQFVKRTENCPVAPENVRFLHDHGYPFNPDVHPAGVSEIVEVSSPPEPSNPPLVTWATVNNSTRLEILLRVISFMEPEDSIKIVHQMPELKGYDGTLYRDLALERVSMCPKKHLLFLYMWYAKYNRALTEKEASEFNIEQFLDPVEWFKLGFTWGEILLATARPWMGLQSADYIYLLLQVDMIKNDNPGPRDIAIRPHLFDKDKYEIACRWSQYYLNNQIYTHQETIQGLRWWHRLNYPTKGTVDRIGNAGKHCYRKRAEFVRVAKGTLQNVAEGAQVGLNIGALFAVYMAIVYIVMRIYIRAIRRL